MTLYALLLQACGLSHREAAELHGVRVDTVKSWSAGRNAAPATAIAELRALHSELDVAARRGAEVMGGWPPGRVELGYPADDWAARDLGLPCVGAWRAMAGMILARTDRDVVLVPRGSTPATAAAIDAHRL